MMILDDSRLFITDAAICARCRIAIPDAWIPLEVHTSWRAEVLRFCIECARIAWGKRQGLR
jgi:hypothetical protein